MTPSPQHQDTLTETVHCPGCGAAVEAEAVTVLRPDDPALEELFDGSLNQNVCEVCNTPFLLKKPLVFRDDDERYLVYYMPIDNASKWEEAEAQMAEITKRVFEQGDDLQTPTFRLALTRNGFIEKIALHLDGLDDRLVEYVKYQLYNNPNQNINPVRHVLFYNFSAQEEGQLAFIVFDRESGKAAAAAHIPMEVFDELAGNFLHNDAMKKELEALFPGYFVSVERLL